MKTLVFFLEEPSAKEMLEGLLPIILPEDIYLKFIIFEGKQDLAKNLALKLRAWRIPNCVFLIMQDQDSTDCRRLKRDLLKICEENSIHPMKVRIACHELESFYLGDLNAVEAGLKIPGLNQKQQKEKFRYPDRLENPANELINLTKGVYQKISGSRAIAPHLDSNNNRSHSFSVLVKGIKKLMER